jgi:hypothetical protein
MPLHSAPRNSSRITGRQEACGLAAMAIGVLLLSIGTVISKSGYDIALAYHGGQVAWKKGHPEHLATWISTPFLAFVMATVSRMTSAVRTAHLLSLANLLLLISLIAGTWHALVSRLSRNTWWISLAAATLFAPAISALWWVQLEIITLSLVVLAYVLLHRQPRSIIAPFLIALSISIKPMAIVLLLALLWKRDSRRAGVLAIGFTVVLLGIGQAFLAWRARSLHALNPIPLFNNFETKSLPANIWVCHPENFSPQSALCRLAGSSGWTAQRIVVDLFVALVIFLGARSVRDHAGLSWEVFALACALSPLVSPIAWSHYQIMLAPILVVLLVHYARAREEGRPFSLEQKLLALLGFMLCELVWRPAGTLPTEIGQWFAGSAQTDARMDVVFSIAMFAQYVVLGAAISVFNAERAHRQGPGPERAAGTSPDLKLSVALDEAAQPSV